MQKTWARAVRLAALGLTLVVVIGFLSYLGFRLVEATSYPDAKLKSDAASYPPALVYNVRRTLNEQSGVNFGLALAAPREGDWGVVLQESDFDAAQRAGFHYIRVQVRFLSYLTRQGEDYGLDPALLSRLDWVIKNILDRRMIAIINFYNLVPDEKLTFGSSDEGRQNKEAFLSVWRILADRYRDYPADLYFELANEPHRPITPSLWNEYVDKGLALIRDSGGGNRTRMVVVGTQIRIGWIIHNWDQVNGIEDLRLPPAETDPNILVTFHYYNPYSFTYQGQTYNKDLALASRIWRGNTWVDSDRQREYVQRDLDVIARWAQENRRKVILGEFGVSVYADFSSQVRWTRLVRAEAESRGMIWVFWDFFSADKLGSLYNQSTGAWRGPILDALLPEAEWRYGDGNVDQSKAYVRQLVKELGDQEWSVRRDAAAALKLTGPDGEIAVPALTAALGDEEWQVRRPAAEALANLGPASEHAVPALIRALKDAEWQVRKPAADALAAIGVASRPALPELLDMVDDEEWQIRKAAILALGSIAPDDMTVRKALQGLFNDPEPQVRQAAEHALGAVN
jgi:endoglucanase